jgi:hypothetical protein
VSSKTSIRPATVRCCRLLTRWKFNNFRAILIILVTFSISLLLHQLSTLQNCPITPAGQPSDICFLTCIFGDDASKVDQPANVEYFVNNWCNVQFILVTNLSKLQSTGWTKKVIETTTSSKNYVVQSREAKFLSWKVFPSISRECAVVVYLDGYLKPKMSWHETSTQAYQKFTNLIQKTKNNYWGLAQVKQQYFNGLEMTTILQNLVKDHKDTIEHVNTTLHWFQQQNDYNKIMIYYLNKYFGTYVHTLLCGCILCVMSG